MKKLHWRYLLSSVLMLGAIQVAVAADFDPLQPQVIPEESTDTQSQSESSKERETIEKREQIQQTESSETNTKRSNPSMIRAMVESILQQLRREEPPLGSRNNLCAIAPGLLGDTDAVWHLRPWFWWEGEAQEVVLSDYETSEIIWSASVASMQSVQYTGDALVPGQVYLWEITRSDGSTNRYTFALMSQPERDGLQQQLDELEQNTDHHLLHLAQAQIFADQNLWSDALQSLNEVANTPEIQGLKQEIKGYLCSSKQIVWER